MGTSLFLSVSAIVFLGVVPALVLRWMLTKPEARVEQVTSGAVTRSAALVAFFFGADKVMGLWREMAVGRIFGATAVLDAYIAAFEIPEGLNTIVTGAALTTSLIPVLTNVISRDERQDLWRFVSAVVNWVMLIVSCASIVAAVFARPIILTVAPGFAGDAEQVALASQLMRLVLVQTLIFSLSTIVTGTLQAHQHFMLPALAPLYYTLGRIFGALILAPRIGIFGLAWGGLLGAVCHLAVKLPWLIRYKAHWTPTLKHAELPALLKLMTPRMLGMGATYVNFVLPTTLGSLLAAGAISAYEYGWKLMQLPETVLGTAMGIVALPALSEMAARGDREGVRNTFSWVLRLILALAIPAAAGLLLLGRPLIVILLQGGAFDAATTERVYWALRFFSIGLVGHASLEVVARLFYARRDMWTPFYAALAGLGVNAGLGWLLLPTLEHGAIALSNSLGAWTQVVVLLLVARRQLQGIDGWTIAKSLARTLAAAVAMVAAVWGLLRVLPDGGLLAAVAGLGVGLIIYVAAALLLKSEEIRALPRLLLRWRAG